MLKVFSKKISGEKLSNDSSDGQHVSLQARIINQDHRQPIVDSIMSDLERGIHHFRAGNTGMAEYYFREVIHDGDRQGKLAYSYLALIYQQREDKVKSREYLENALHEEKPVPARAYSDQLFINAGMFFYTEDRMLLAQVNFMKAAITNPNNAEPYKWLSRISQALGDIEQAKGRMEIALSKDSNNPQLHADLAIIHYIQGSTQKAIGYASQALAMGLKSPSMESIMRELPKIIRQQ